MAEPRDAAGSTAKRMAGEAAMANDRAEAKERRAYLPGERLYHMAGLLFILAVVFRFFDEISRVLLLAFLGAIIAVAYNALIRRIPLRRGLAVALLALLTLGTIGLGAWLGIGALVGQFRQFVDDFPAIVEGAENWVQDALGLEIELLGPRAREIISEIIGPAEGVALILGAFGLVEVIAIMLLVLVGAFFVVAKPNEQLLEPLMRAVPRARRPAVRRMFSLMGERLAGWLWGTLLSMLAVGVLSIIAFYVLGTPYPLLLGVILGVTDIIPIVGPWIGGIVAVAVTLFTNPGLALWVAVAVIVIQEIESNLVRPIVMSESVRVHPFVTLLALLLFASLFGLLGAILALPIALAIGTIVQVLWVEGTLDAGDDDIEPVVST